MICDLPDDLLLRILCFVPTKDAVATSILSKRWRCLWTMLPELEFDDEEGSDTLGPLGGGFVDKPLQLHKAPKLRCLTVELGPSCPVDVYVRNWAETAVNRGVKLLDFSLLWTAEHTSFPKSFYTCDTLVSLTLSNQILVDVSSPASLPSLLDLNLENVVYKDEDSFVRLLSSSPILETLYVLRDKADNLKNVTVKVPSLQLLRYYSWCQDEEEEGEDDDDLIGSYLVIDSPSLIEVQLVNYGEARFLIENMPCLNVANMDSNNNPDYEYLRSLSSVVHLHLFLTQSMVACCNDIKFSRLIEFYLCPHKSVDWLEPLMGFLQNSPKLETLMINTKTGGRPLSCNQPSTIHGCLLSHLEIFRWRDYGGREYEK